jgi:hypothetical protein
VGLLRAFNGACFMLAGVRTPSSWTNFSALPALFTGQRERESEKEGWRERDKQGRRER